MATLRIDNEAFREACEQAGLDSNKAIARRMGIDTSTLSRVTSGKQTPGPKFIAGAVRAFGTLRFPEVFKVVSIVGLMTLGIFAAPLASADPACYGYQCQPAPWNGQLMPTWRAPGFYGGWTNTPVWCDQFTYQCRGIAPNPNGG